MERKVVIRKSKHFFERKSKILKTIGLSALVLSIPLTLYVLNQVQDIRQHAAGNLIPITSNFPQTGCPVTFTDLPASSTKSYKVPVFCLNQSYCVTSGYDAQTAPTVGLTYPAFGGDIATSRKFAVAFITHYHTQVLKDWTMQPFTGTVFPDVPPGFNLGPEIETAVHYGFIQGNGGLFHPEDPWTFGFHGVTRSDQWPAGQGYNFNVAGSPITRGDFLQQMYNYGIDPSHQNLTLCMVAPTAPPPTTAPTATPIPQVACNTACTSDAQCSTATGGCTVCKPNSTPAPILDFTKLTGSSCPRNFASKLPDGSYREPTYPDAPYRLAVECMNKGYCVVQGYTETTCPAGANCSGLNESATPPDGYVGGEVATSRKFAVAFITRYHADVIPAGDPRHWDWVTPTGKVFFDMPSGTDLGREIETAYKYGFVQGNPCNTIYKPGDPFYSADSNVKCFDPESDWLFGFKGIEKSDYFSGSSPINPWNFAIKRGDFLQGLYTFGTAAEHPDLAKCMSAPGTAGSCQQPAACNVGCMKDGDCSGAKDGCTVCTGATATTPGKCTPFPAACGSSCSRDSDCGGDAAKNGCTSCLGGKCSAPFDTSACKCDGMDATQIGSGQAVTFTAYSKIEGSDVSTAIVKGVNIRVFRGGAEVANQIAESGFLPPSVIENTPTKIRYKTDWRYTIPADAQNGDLFRVQADIQCVPRILALAPSQNGATPEKGIIAKIVDKVTEPIRAVLGLNISPTPVAPKSLQISSFYPGEIIDKSCNYFHFVIKR